MTALEFINLVEERAQYPLSTTIEGQNLRPETRKLVNLLQHVLRVLQRKDDWPRLKANGHIVTLAPVVADGVTETAAVAIGGTTVSVTGITLTTDMEGAAIQFDDASDYIYTIEEVKSASTLVLQEPFTHSTNLTSSGFTIAQDTYELASDFDRPIENWKSFFGASELVALDDYDFMQLRRQDNSLETGEPQYYTVLGLNRTNTVMQVAFHPYPSAKRLYKYRYMRLHPEIAQDGTPILYPEAQIDIILQAMLDVITRDFEDDATMVRTLQDSLDASNQALRGNTLTERPFTIMPAQGAKARERARWLLRGRRYDYGALFDVVGFRTKGR